MQRLKEQREVEFALVRRERIAAALLERHPRGRLRLGGEPFARQRDAMRVDIDAEESRRGVRPCQRPHEIANAAADVDDGGAGAQPRLELRQARERGIDEGGLGAAREHADVVREGWPALLVAIDGAIAERLRVAAEVLAGDIDVEVDR